MHKKCEKNTPHLTALDNSIQKENQQTDKEMDSSWSTVCVCVWPLSGFPHYIHVIKLFMSISVSSELL